MNPQTTGMLDWMKRSLSSLRGRLPLPPAALLDISSPLRGAPSSPRADTSVAPPDVPPSTDRPPAPDLLTMSLTPEQRAFVDRFDRLCHERIAPRAKEADRTGILPKDSWDDLAFAGYFALFHPPEWGGSGADGLVQSFAMESLAKACASTFWAASISTVLCGKMLHDLCAPHHHEGWLRPIVSGRKMGCFAATEEGAGSDPGSYQTTVRRTGRGLRLRGQKSRVSNAVSADVAVVLARIDDAPRQGLCYAVVDLQRSGIVREEQPKVGLSAMSWGTIAFDDIEIADEDVITSASMDRTLRAVEWGQLLQTFCAIGLSEAAFDATRDHALSRHAFGRPIAHMQVVHARLADMRAEIDAARLLAVEVAWKKAEGQIARDPVMMAKIHATEMAVRLADMAMRTFGGWGYSKAHIIERLYRDTLANVPAGLPTDRLRELLACPLTGADPWTYTPFDWLPPSSLSLSDP